MKQDDLDKKKKPHHHHVDEENRQRLVIRQRELVYHGWPPAINNPTLINRIKNES
jgi:hypothetical protein